MEIKYLEVLVMPNNEIICLGKTIGWLTNEDLKKHLFTEKQLLDRAIEKKVQGVSDET